MENDELQHYGVVGMKWGVRKKVYASETKRRSQHKESMTNIKQTYNERIKKQKALTKASKGTNPTVHKLSKETEKYLRSEKKYNLSAEKDRYKYHHSKKGDTDVDAYAQIKSNAENVSKAKKAYKKDPSDANKKSFEKAYEKGLLYTHSDAYKTYMRNMYVTGTLAGPTVAMGRRFALERQSQKLANN